MGQAILGNFENVGILGPYSGYTNDLYACRDGACYLGDLGPVRVGRMILWIFMRPGDDEILPC